MKLRHKVVTAGLLMLSAQLGMAATCSGKPATIYGTPDADVIQGTMAPDVIVSFGGVDKIVGGLGNDRICSGVGNDMVRGGPGNDRLYGEIGDDKIQGGRDNDLLVTGPGRDTAIGELGSDSLINKGGTVNDADRFAGEYALDDPRYVAHDFGFNPPVGFRNFCSGVNAGASDCLSLNDFYLNPRRPPVPRWLIVQALINGVYYPNPNQ